MTTAIAIVNWNSGARLLTCIESVLATSMDVEIVVVDNASTDDSMDLAAELRARVKVISNSTNHGLATAMNQAFAATSTPYVLMLNPDVRATAGALAHLERVMNGQPGAGAVGGYVNETYLPRELPTMGRLVRENLGLAARSNGRARGSDAYIVEQPAASALLIRRAAYDEIGGFDDRFYPAWYEDVDFCKRLKTAGWQVYFAPKAEFFHEGGYGAKTLGADAFHRAYYENQLRYAKKHLGSAATLGVRLSIAAGMAGRMIIRPDQARTRWKTILGALGEW